MMKKHTPLTQQQMTAFEEAQLPRAPDKYTQEQKSKFQEIIQKIKREWKDGRLEIDYSPLTPEEMFAIDLTYGEGFTDAFHPDDIKRQILESNDKGMLGWLPVNIQLSDRRGIEVGERMINAQRVTTLNRLIEIEKTDKSATEKTENRIKAESQKNGRTGGKHPKRRAWAEAIAEHLKSQNPRATKAAMWATIPESANPADINNQENGDIQYYHDDNRLFASVDGGQTQSITQKVFFDDYLRTRKPA